MRLPDLERELAWLGYTFSRQTGSHRIYKHTVTGKPLVFANPACGHRHEVDGVVLRKIRQTARQRAHLQDSDEEA